MTKNIYTQLALCKFPTVEKDSVNPQFKKSDNKPTYASLPSVLSAVVPVLKEHGVVLSSYIREDHSDILVVRLTHGESETSIQSHVKLIDMSTMQKWGGSVTYGTRYGLLSLLGIAADMDDDGNTASQPSNPVTKVFTPVSPVTPHVAKVVPVTSERMKLVHDLTNLWEMKEGSVRAEESAASRRTIQLFKNDFKEANGDDLTDEQLLKIKDYMSAL